MRLQAATPTPWIASLRSQRREVRHREERSDAATQWLGMLRYRNKHPQLTPACKSAALAADSWWRAKSTPLS